MDKNKIIDSFYGNPLKGFTLYPGCEYLYNGVCCCYLEPKRDTLTDTDKVSILIKGATAPNTVDRTSISPIELTVEILDNDRNDSSINLADGVKVWRYKKAVPPFEIIYNGIYFVYTDSKYKEKGIDPQPISYISDLQAIRSAYNS